MAGNSRRRVNSSRSKYYYRDESYVSGNTVRKLTYEPQEDPRQKERERKKTVSNSVRRNRVKAMQMGRGYVMFLAVVSVITLALCVNYLQLRAKYTNQLEDIASQESELSTLKADNDALYNAVMASVDLDKIKETAINELGMKYPTEDQIETYDTVGDSYVRQYEDVPESK